jgi:ribosome-associated protein YbcJ (S4-like RNA binding protein)
VIAEYLVLINGKVETHKRKKIVSGDSVAFGKEEICIQLKWVWHGKV